MAEKTVLKTLLSKYAPMSIEIQNAIKLDQAVFNNDNTYAYADNEKETDGKTTISNSFTSDENGEVESTEEVVVEVVE